MKNSFWVAIVVVALVVGVLVGYGVWGPDAAKLPEVESELKALQDQAAQVKKKEASLQANLGRVTKEKLNLEKQNADLRAALEKVEKAPKEKAAKRHR